MEVHELLGVRPANAKDSAFLEPWNRGQRAYQERRFGEAARHFARALELRPEDGPSQVFMRRCQDLDTTGMPATWDGSWHFDRK
jgi:adenylate cyclase